jgi:hypothetical protein
MFWLIVLLLIVLAVTARPLVAAPVIAFVGAFGRTR